MGEVTSYFLGRRHEFWHQNHSRKISKAKPRGHTGGFMEWFRKSACGILPARESGTCIKDKSC
jgi:hypothetical protein